MEKPVNEFVIEKYIEISIGMSLKSSKLLSSFINLMCDIVEID